MATHRINTFLQHLMNESRLAKKPKRDPYPTSSGVQSMAKDELTDYGSAVVDNARSRASDVGAAIKGAVRGDLKPAHTALINVVDAAVDAPGNVAARVGSAFKPDAKYGTTETRKGTTRAEVEQGMRDDERESGRRIGAFKHPKPEPKPQAVTRGSVDMMGRLDALPMGEIRRAVTGAAAARALRQTRALRLPGGIEPAQAQGEADDAAATRAIQAMPGMDDIPRKAGRIPPFKNIFK